MHACTSQCCVECACMLHTLNLEHEVRNCNDVYRNNNVCAQCAIIFVVAAAAGWVYVSVWVQMCCICGSMMCIKTIAMQSRSAKQQRQKRHHQQQAYPELHKNPSKVPKAIATRLHICICIIQHENTKQNARSYSWLFLSLPFLFVTWAHR